MTDDWSLKDKKAYRSTGMHYTDTTIEILRKKLIDDIMNTEFTQHLPDWSKEEIIKIINKRFGVEE